MICFSFVILWYCRNILCPAFGISTISLDKWKDNCDCVLLYRLCNKPRDFANSDLHLRLKMVLVFQQCALNKLTTFWIKNSNSVVQKCEKGFLFLLDKLFPLSCVGRVCATLNVVKITCSLMLLPSAQLWWDPAGGLWLLLSVSLQESGLCPAKCHGKQQNS